MQLLLILAGLILLLRGPGVARLAGAALVALAAFWLASSARSLAPENVRRIAQLRRENMSPGLRELLDKGRVRQDPTEDKLERRDRDKPKRTEDDAARRPVGEDSFSIHCNHCGQALQLRYHPESMGQLRCVRCARIAFWMQLDERGTWRTMPEYFELTPSPVGGEVGIAWAYFIERFSYDHAKARSKDPVWQTTPYTTRTMTGVCRDSATAVADWLVASGHQAAVATGEVTFASPYGSRHAWTVVSANGVDYILETTGPSRFSRAKTPPRADLMTEYFPNAKFSREGVWGETGKGRIVDYDSPDLWYQVVH